MESQLSLFENAEIRRDFRRLANGRFCTKDQREKDDEERTIMAIKHENQMLRRQSIAQDKLIQQLLKDIQHERSKNSQ